MKEEAARARADQPGLLALIAQPVRALRTEVQGAAGVADPLDELDGGFAAASDGRELVEDEGGVLALPWLSEGGVVGEVLQ
jgi:hypothetical protein